MRKRLIHLHPTANLGELSNEKWLDLPALAEVEITSEAESYPIESALVSPAKDGWRAAEPGEQRMRLIFDEPQQITRILLIFEEHERAKSHEFVLRWSDRVEGSYRDIVRQQWNFSPAGAVREVEDYRVQLFRVKVLELIITATVGGKEAIASLMQLRVA
jgi:hypothetical protein